MPVHRFPTIVRRLHLRQAARVAIKNSRKVHHLAEIQNSRVIEQRLNLGYRNLGASSFKSCRRHARRRTEEKLERHLRRVLKHVMHAGNAEHIPNLMRIAHRRHGPMHNRRPREFAWH